jgi:hypothetical protein
VQEQEDDGHRQQRTLDQRVLQIVYRVRRQSHLGGVDGGPAISHASPISVFTGFSLEPPSRCHQPVLRMSRNANCLVSGG